MDDTHSGSFQHANSWFGTGQAYRDVPEHVQVHAKNALAIPAGYLTLLPSPGLTIDQLLELSFPPVLERIPPGLSVQTIFTRSPAPSLVDLAGLWKEPLLPQSFLMAAERVLPQAWLDGMSVCHPATNTLFPLWAIPFWLALHTGCDAHTRWTASNQWLETVRMRNLSADSSLALCIEKTREFMHTTHWTADLTNVHPDLLLPRLSSRLLADNLLGTWDMDAMLAVLQYRAGDMSPIAIFDSTLVNTILKLQSPAEQKRYSTGPFNVLRAAGVGFQIRATKQILFAYHLGHIDHWAACELRRLDGLQVQISFGDSLDIEPPAQLRHALAAWMSVLGLTVVEQDQPRSLPHGMQSDGVSCGIACINTIEHAAFGVPRFRAARRDVFRLTKFLELMQFHRNQQSSSLLPLELWDAGAMSGERAAHSPLPTHAPIGALDADSVPMPALVSGGSSAPALPPAAASPVAMAVHAQPKPARQSTLPFRPLTAEQKRLRREKELQTASEREEQRHIERDDYDWAKEQADKKKAAELRLATKHRVREFRERKRLNDVKLGLRPATGRKPVRFLSSHPLTLTCL